MLVLQTNSFLLIQGKFWFPFIFNDIPVEMED